MSMAQAASIIGASVALLGVFVQAVVYAYREGRKEQRLSTVEDRVRNVPAQEGVLSAMGANLEGLRTQLNDLKTDLKGDIGEINHVIRNHLMGKTVRGDR